MHRNPDHSDTPAPDPDATGYDGREHYAPAAAPTMYQIWHHDKPVSREYGSATEAELFRIFQTPGTPDYTVRAVRATPTTEPR